MRIAGNKIQPSALTLEAGQRSERGGKATAATAAATDTVKLSGSTGAVNRALANDEAARTARIAEVKAQIQSGGYPLDFASLAEKMVDDELGHDQLGHGEP